LFVGSVVITQMTDEHRQARAFKRKLERLGVKVYRHYPIKGYPNDVNLVVSDAGYGRNEYIETERDLVVVTAGVPVGISGTTNMIKVHMVGDSLLAGVGIGNHNAKGEVCVCRNATEAAKKFKPGQILVVPFTTNDTLPFMREAAGIITEEAGTNSHSAIVGLTLDKAVIVGATNATRTLKDGMTISMDCARGVVQAMAK
ncbi:MAG TPA: DUF1846 family protein, partial [Gemmiger formicilis]|nr:DUF1846 family protein [Gemmiger formicilis]